MKNWTIADWTRAIAENNRDKGWRDEKVLFGSPEGAARFVAVQLMLITSEAAEALEDVRAGHFAASTNSQNGKPEGLPSELADIMIRTLDLADMLGIDMTRALEEKHSYNLGRAHRHGGKLL